MNKKLFFSMFAATGMLLTTSCSNDELATVQSEEKVQVTFSLGVEDGIGSRAAISDGTNINKLVYGVFDSEGKPLSVLDVNGEFKSQKVDEVKDITTTPHSISITLAKGQSYQVAFWAQNADCNAYNTEDLKAVKIDYAGVNNDDLRDAFFKTVPFEVNGNKTIDVVLQRPFAQINVGVTQEDWEAAIRSGINVMESSVVIYNAATKINLLDGSVKEPVEVTYNFAKIPAQYDTPEALEVDVDGDGTLEKYKWLSMSYILVDDTNETDKDNDGTLGDAGATLEGLKYTFKPQDGKRPIEFSKGLAGAPVQRNWRTNIVGRILTGDVNFNITVDNKFENSNIYPNESDQELQFAATFGGSVTLEKDVELTSPLKVSSNLTINLNGKTIYGAFAKGDSAVVDVAEGVTAEIVGGNIKSTKENGDAAINNAGKLVLKDVTIEGAPLADGGYSAYAVISSGNLVIEEGTVVSADRGCLKFSGAGETVINGGHFTNKDIGTISLTSHVVDVEDGGSHKLTINGGTFEHLHSTTSGGVVICNRTSGTVYVNGGNFSGGNYYGNNNLSDYGYGGTFAVTGGVYTANPAAKYIVTGYKAIEKVGLYYVVADDVDAVVSDATELEAALAAGGEVVLADDVTYTSNKIKNDAVINLNGNTFTPSTAINLYNNANLTMVGGNYEVNVGSGYVDVRPSSADGSVVVYENVHFKSNYINKTFGTSTDRLNSVVEVCAAATDAKTVVKFKNCTFDNGKVLIEGMSGKTGIVEAVFEGCTFNALTNSSPIDVMNYVTATIKVKDCTFNLECTSGVASAIDVSPSNSTSVVLTATNNTFNAVAATPYTYDASKGETEAHNVKVHGTPANIMFISAYDNTTVTETGTKKSGIAKL